MLARLEAEAELQTFRAVAAGSGRMKDSKGYARTLRAATRSREPARRATAADLQGLGIEVVEGDES